MNQLEEMIEKEQQKTLKIFSSPDITLPPNTANIVRRDAVIHTPSLPPTTAAQPMKESTTLSLPVMTLRPSFGAASAAMEQESHCSTRSRNSTSCSCIEDEDMSHESDRNISREATPELQHEEFLSYPEEESFAVSNITFSATGDSVGSRLTSLFQSI